MTLDDSKLVNDVVDRLKKQGLFDRFRKECMADVDTKVSNMVLLLLATGDMRTVDLKQSKAKL